jgi:hypothetical protein
MPLRLALASIALMVLSVFAFWPEYLSKIRYADAYTHSHAFLGSAWLLLLVVQPLLIRSAKLALHRLVGRLACLVGAAFVVSGLLTAHHGVLRMNAEQFAGEGHSVYLPLVMAGLFAAALALGIVWRSVPAVHSRFMACTALPLLDPLIARILYFYFPPLPAAFLYQLPAVSLATVLLLLLARSLPGMAPGCLAFQSFVGGTIIALLLIFATPFSSRWMQFAEWFRELPLT